MERCQTSVSLICSYGGVNTQTLKDRESPCGLYSDTCLWWLSVHCQLLTALRAPLWASPQNTVTITELSKWVIHMSLWWLTPWQLLLIAAWTAAINWFINMKRVLKVMRILIRQSGDGESQNIHLKYIHCDSLRTFIYIYIHYDHEHSLVVILYLCHDM